MKCDNQKVLIMSYMLTESLNRKELLKTIILLISEYFRESEEWWIMITLFLMALISIIFNLSLSVSRDAQIIVFAICIASDLNMFSRMMEKWG